MMTYKNHAIFVSLIRYRLCNPSYVQPGMNTARLIKRLVLFSMMHIYDIESKPKGLSRTSNTQHPILLLKIGTLIMFY